MSDLPLHPESVVVAAGRPTAPGEPLSTPIIPAAPFRAGPGYNSYVRTDGSAGIAALEEALGALDGGTATVFASGMAATAAVVQTRPARSVLVVPTAGYWGSLSLFNAQQQLGHVELRPVDITDTDAVLAALHPADGPSADVLWLETVTNPLIGVPDLSLLIEAAHQQDVIVCVDATFTTPLNCRPLDLGADVVMHSVTKYLSGHSDLVQGVLITRSEELTTTFRGHRMLGGAVPGALECYLSLRGLRTLAVRLERQQVNAADLAGRLSEHPRIARVRYPGLPDDPGYERATRLFSGYGAMISFEVAGSAEDAAAVCDRVRLITHSTSLGGVESLVERRAMWEGDASMGVPQTLIRFSVGIENVEDLWTDLAQALGE
ncbi:MAG TPA: PLP-dependent transferase [Jatrophihabitans sp.]|jgi:cystathionine gamma-synthase